MYLYFDNNGILKEIVDDVATRKGNNEVNRLYIYVDGITPKTEWITYQTSDGVQSNETLIETTITKTIPYDRNRDLKYFKNFQEYLFYVATIPSSVLTVSGLTKASVRVALQDDSLMTLGLIIFTIEDSVVLQDSFITESQYQYLLNIISNFEELNNTGVIGISTQIVNGAVAPYDQGRIVLSTYNDNFAIATVVKNSAGQNVYNVLDMTFVKQVPYDNSKPNLEGLEINGKKYKVAYKTSQLNNDAGFITNAVSNLINYYDKTTVDEKLANIDLSEYYTKTESDDRYVLTTNFSWNNLANKPTSLSDFINDEGFIDNTVSNLANYYDKTTIDNIVATLKTGAFQVVSELPSTGVEGVVYLVGTEAPYTMYIWENNAFLDIGTTEVNLDGYVKGTNLNSNYVILGNGGSNVVASIYTINNQNANDPNSLLTAKVINTLLGTKQDVLTEGQGVKISDNVISTPVSTISTIIYQQSVNKLKYDGKPILVDYAVNDDSGNIIADTYATFNDLHTLDIGDITSSSNIYQTLYQNVYENDTTKKNVVIFSTEGFVDSATSLISAGQHIATPYQDNKILIDSVFVLNSDNSATSIVSSDTVVIDIGTITGETGTLSPDVLSKINNAISENKNIVIKTNEGENENETVNSVFSNVMYVAGAVLYATRLLTTTISFIMIELPSGQYTMVSNIELQEALVSGTNIKTINGQSVLGSGNIKIEVSGTGFQIIDVSNDRSPNTSISNIYDRIINSQSLNFSSQLPVYTNIRTAINGGLVPILKFSDGYGYYKEYLSSSSEYVFTLNHIDKPELLDNPFNNIITLRVGNEKNAGGYDNLSQIPYTVTLLSDFGDSGTLDSFSSAFLFKAMRSAEAKSSLGIFILNKTKDKTYFVSSIQKSPSTSLIAYTISQGNIEVVNLVYANKLFNYSKTTYALGGGSGESNSITIDLGTLSSSGGTLSSEILTQINNNLESKSIIFEITSGGMSFTTSSYATSGNALALSFLQGFVALTLVITLTTGSYTLSQATLLDTLDVKTINNTSLVGAGNIETGLPARQYTISNLDFINFSEGQSVSISASDSAIIENARTKQASVIYNDVSSQYLPLLYVEVANDVQVLYSDLLGHCGVVKIDTTNKTATVLSVFKTGKNSTINLDTISSTKTNYDNVFNYLVDQGFARAYFNVEGFLDPTNSIGNEQYYEAYLSGENKYFASCGKIYEYIVDTSSQGFHVELVGNSLFRPISKNTLRFKGNEILKISPTSTLTNVSILLGANVSKGHKKYTFDNPRMNFQLKPSFDNSFAFDTSTKEINIAESIYTKLFTWSHETNTVVPTVSSTKVSTWYPTNWHKGTVASGKITATILDFSNLPSGTTYNAFFNGFNFPDPISFKFNNMMDKYQEYRTFRFSLRFVFDYQGVKRLPTDKSYSKKWTGTLQNKYLEVIARLDFTNKQVVIYQRIRKFA